MDNRVRKLPPALIAVSIQCHKQFRVSKQLSIAQNLVRRSAKLVIGNAIVNFVLLVTRVARIDTPTTRCCMLDNAMGLDNVFQ